MDVFLFFLYCKGRFSAYCSLVTCFILRQLAPLWKFFEKNSSHDVLKQIITSQIGRVCCFALVLSGNLNEIEQSSEDGKV